MVKLFVHRPYLRKKNSLLLVKMGLLKSSMRSLFQYTKKKMLLKDQPSPPKLALKRMKKMFLFDYHKP